TGGPLGPPHRSAEVRDLIATMAHDNPRWGSERIRGELLKLGVVVSKRSIQRYRRRGPAHPASQTWRTFLSNHAHHVWAADLLTPTLGSWQQPADLEVVQTGAWILPDERPLPADLRGVPCRRDTARVHRLRQYPDARVKG